MPPTLRNNPYINYAAMPHRYVFDWNAGQGGVLPAHAYQSRAPSSSLGAADLLEGGYGDPNFEYNYPALAKVAPKRYCPPVSAPCGLRAKAAAELAGLGASVAEYPTGILTQIGSAIVGGIKTTFSGGSAGGGATTWLPVGPKARVATTMGPRGRHFGDRNAMVATGEWPLVRQQGFEPGWMATGSIPIWDGLSDTQKMIAFVAASAGALWLLSRGNKTPMGLATRRGRRNPWAVSARARRGVTGSLVFRKKKDARAYAEYLKADESFKRKPRVRRLKKR